jgi:hypothetical protein
LTTPVPFVISGDTAVFPANCCSGAITPELSFPLTGTGKASVGGKAVCVAGDEAKVAVVCSYTTSTLTIPGAAELKIKALVPAQQSQVATSGKKAAILATNKFDVEMTVKTAASVVTAAGATQTDPLATYTGKGSFKSQNTAAKASK